MATPTSSMSTSSRDGDLTFVFSSSASNSASDSRNCPLQPRLMHLDDDRFLQTILITTSYRGGRLVPQLGAFYDWQGAWVVQPGLTVIRDPFRFVMDYTGVFGAPTGQFGAVLDRDNVRFQVEYVF